MGGKKYDLGLHESATKVCPLWAMTSARECGVGVEIPVWCLV